MTLFIPLPSKSHFYCSFSFILLSKHTNKKNQAKTGKCVQKGAHKKMVYTLTPHNGGQSVSAYKSATQCQRPTKQHRRPNTICHKMRQSITHIDVLATNAPSALTSAWFTVLLLTPTDSNDCFTFLLLAAVMLLDADKGVLVQTQLVHSRSQRLANRSAWCSAVAEVIQRFNDWLAGVVFVVEN